MHLHLGHIHKIGTSCKPKNIEHIKDVACSEGEQKGCNLGVMTLSLRK